MLDPMEGSPAQFLFTAHDNRGRKGAFDYYKAQNGLIFIDKVPQDLGDYYEGGFDPIPTSEAGLAKIACGDEYKIEPILRYQPQGRYLEIGPWIGKAAYHARNAGYTVSAIERDPRCVALMRSVGIDAMQDDNPAAKLAELKSEGKSFDAIALWHSIEHLPRPWDVIERAIDVLAPQGVLLISAPNPESAQFRVFGRHWYHLDAPRHLYLLPIELLKSIAQSRGLTVLEVTTDDARGVIEDDYGWMWQVRRWLRHIPVVRRKVGELIGPYLKKRYRQPGTLDGAGYTIIMRKSG